MTHSEDWFKKLRRFGSRLSLDSSSRSSAEPQVWLARYDHAREKAGCDVGVDEDGYSSSVELVRVKLQEENISPELPSCSSQDLETSPGSATELHEDGEESLSSSEHQQPSSSDPQVFRRRPLPELPPRQRGDDGRLRVLSAQLAHLSYQGWYWGPLTLDETQVILADLPDGSYLVRDSRNDAYLLALGMRADGRTIHTRISHCNGRFMFAHQRHGTAGTIDELIRKGIYVRGRHRQLLHPVSRLMRMRSLKEYSRFAIRRHIAIDRIDDLEIPLTLKSFLKENPY